MGGGPSMGAGLDPQASSQCFTRDQKSRRQVSIRFGSKQKNEALILSSGKNEALIFLERKNEALIFPTGK
jgi:hypothetical protein